MPGHALLDRISLELHREAARIARDPSHVERARARLVAAMADRRIWRRVRGEAER